MGDSAGFLRQVLERDVEERHIRMLELQLLLSNWKRPVADGPVFSDFDRGQPVYARMSVIVGDQSLRGAKVADALASVVC